MKNSIKEAFKGLAALFLLTSATAVNAAELKVLSVLGLQAVMDELGPRFERTTGHRLEVLLLTSGGVLKRVEDGETAHLIIMPRQGIDRLVKEGRATADSVEVIARSSMGVAVRKGSPRPDISSPVAFTRALLAAKSVTYPDPAHGAASGIHFARVLDRLGIAAQIRPKTVFLPTAGAVGVLVAKGQAELAVHQIQELLPVEGVDIVGPLPSELQENLVFTAAIMAGVRDVEAARALIDFLRSPESVRAIKAKGMEPD